MKMPAHARSVLILSVSAVTLSGILLFFLAHRRQSPGLPPTEPASSAGPVPGQSALGSANSPTRALSPAAVRAVATLTPDRRIADAAERARLARQIDEARQAREAQPPPANLRAAEKEQEPGLDKAYIRGQLLEVMPLVKECYENALENNPKLEGRLIVHFSIVAEPRVGGLVDSSEVEREGPLGQEPALVECVQESIYALKLKAPQGGGQVKVSFPFIFRNDGPPDGG